MGVSMGGRSGGGRVAGSRGRPRTPLDDSALDLEAVHAHAALGVSRASQTGGERGKLTAGGLQGQADRRLPVLR